MANRINWERFTNGSTDSYGDIDSLERIRLGDERYRKDSRFPDGFPGQFTPNWWALRQRYETLLARGPQGKTTREGRDLSDVAKCASLGVESAVDDYEALDPSTGLHVHLSWALQVMRDTDPQRFEAVMAESKRLTALGRRRVDVRHLLRTA
jgi:hypothetical protein